MYNKHLQVFLNFQLIIRRVDSFFTLHCRVLLQYHPLLPPSCLRNSCTEQLPWTSLAAEWRSSRHSTS